MHRKGARGLYTEMVTVCIAGLEQFWEVYLLFCIFQFFNNNDLFLSQEKTNNKKAKHKHLSKGFCATASGRPQQSSANLQTQILGKCPQYLLSVSPGDPFLQSDVASYGNLNVYSITTTYSTKPKFVAKITLFSLQK